LLAQKKTKQKKKAPRIKSAFRSQRSNPPLWLTSLCLQADRAIRGRPRSLQFIQLDLEEIFAYFLRALTFFVSFFGSSQKMKKMNR
ncbi:MAG: hypothetical protein KDD20_13405, partial [Mangrovimonas sp.]|nr:hypothetical protein [Mangrovimonas sp.]